MCGERLSLRSLLVVLAVLLVPSCNGTCTHIQFPEKTFEEGEVVPVNEAYAEVTGPYPEFRLGLDECTDDIVNHVGKETCNDGQLITLPETVMYIAKWGDKCLQLPDLNIIDHFNQSKAADYCFQNGLELFSFDSNQDFNDFKNTLLANNLPWLWINGGGQGPFKIWLGLRYDLYNLKWRWANGVEADLAIISGEVEGMDCAVLEYERFNNTLTAMPAACGEMLTDSACYGLPANHWKYPVE